MKLKEQRVLEQFEEKIKIAMEQERLHFNHMGYVKNKTREIKEKYIDWLKQKGLEPTKKEFINL